jgi:hypothetical protein
VVAVPVAAEVVQPAASSIRLEARSAPECGRRKLDMPDQADARVADLEARNQYLGIIDDAWEIYREAAERAWDAYEKSLVPARASYEELQSSTEDAHGRSIDEAWALYKQAVATAPSTMRRDVVAQARVTYNETAAQVRKTYNESMAIGRDIYLQSVHEARSTYRAAVDGELEAHREAVRTAWRNYLEMVDSHLAIDA